ncbi:hypothetical protein Hanom_Chr08g00728941 [Helianthus anomalus]
MHYRAESEGVPHVNVSVDFTEQDWYTTLTRKVTPIIQLEERALVAAWMSMLWAPQNPRGVLVYVWQPRKIHSHPDLTPCCFRLLINFRDEISFKLGMM